MENYSLEIKGQIEFYGKFLPRINPQLKMEDLLSDNNDGVLNGNLLEFKLHIGDLNSVLFQCIKYLSEIRIKGKPVPANIIIVDLNSETAYQFSSEDYLDEIEVPYYGAASKNNNEFVGMMPEKIFAYGKSQIDIEKLICTLKEHKFAKIHIDENCIVGWATSFYKICPNTRKEDFIGDDTGFHKTIGEIRNPRIFADYIYPYEGKSNIKFNYLMDKLNDFLQRKNLGAFYTPELYAKKALELVRKAIERVPDGNDYIILDRCAGTGNLEIFMTDDELSHCIVSTIEYYEYKVLQELLGSKVRHVIPPIESNDTFNAGLVSGADALSKNYVEDEIIRQYIDNPKCTIILFENPPYAETTSVEHQKRKSAKKNSVWKNSFVAKEMKKEIKGTARNDLGNVFIWSGFKYYLRQPADSYIVFSPVKYWKAQHLVNKKLIDGFAFNRRHFHTNTDACIMVALWTNIDDKTTEKLEITGYDIKDKKLIEYPNKLSIKKIKSLFSEKYYDKRPISAENRTGILCGLNGLENTTAKPRILPATVDEIIGYMVANGSCFENPDLNSCLLIAGQYGGNGFYLWHDNYIEKFPMFAASRYITYNRSWTERGRIMKSADGAKRYFRDVQNGKL